MLTQLGAVCGMIPGESQGQLMSSELTQAGGSVKVSVAGGKMSDWLWNGACLGTLDWSSYCSQSLKEALSGNLPEEALPLQMSQLAVLASIVQTSIKNT